MRLLYLLEAVDNYSGPNIPSHKSKRRIKVLQHIFFKYLRLIFIHLEFVRKIRLQAPGPVERNKLPRFEDIKFVTSRQWYS